jgi:hypothetical protein
LHDLAVDALDRRHRGPEHQAAFARSECIDQQLRGLPLSALMLEPGDGRVTKASLLARDSLAPDATQPGFFPIAYTVFICRSHADLPSDVTFRDNLLNILLY